MTRPDRLPWWAVALALLSLVMLVWASSHIPVGAA